jgi:hypothetical protein
MGIHATPWPVEETTGSDGDRSTPGRGVVERSTDNVEDTGIASLAVPGPVAN